MPISSSKNNGWFYGPKKARNNQKEFKPDLRKNKEKNGIINQWCKKHNKKLWDVLRSMGKSYQIVWIILQFYLRLSLKKNVGKD